MSISKVLNYILIVTVLIALSACSSKGGGGDTNTSTPTGNTPTSNTPTQEEALTTIASFISGGTAPTPTDYTNAGVTGVTAENIDSINNLISDTSSPTKTPTTTQIQSVVNIIQGSSTPTDYDVLGITGVTATNISNINSILTSKDIVDINSVAKIDNIVKTTDKLMAGTTLSVDDYSTLGITGVDSNNLSGINQEIASKTASEVDTIEEIKAIVDEFINRDNSVTGDETPPEIVLIGNSTVVVYQGNSYADAGAVVTDNVDATKTIYSSDRVNTSVVGSYTLRYDANDSANNSAIQVTRTVTVVDISTPTIIIYNDTNTTEYGSTYSDAGAIARDGAGNIIDDVTTTGDDFNTSILGEHNITYTATNTLGIKSTAIRTVTVVDTTAPIITIIGDTNMTIAQGDNTYIEESASIRESVDSDMVVVISGEVNSSKLGTYTISYNLTDRSGNKAIEQNRTVTVTDQTVPTITIDGNTTYYHDYNVSYSDMGAFFRDNIDTDSKIYINGVVNPNILGSYILQYNAIDSAGNIAIEQNRTVKVVDRVPPTIDIIGGDEINTTYGVAYTDANATFSDNVVGGVIRHQIEDNVDVDTLGDYNVTYIATDESNNTTTKIRVVHVIDDTPPTITLNGSSTINIVEGESYIEYNATADDDHDTISPSSISIESNMTTNPPTKGNYTVSYNVKDSSQNSAIEVNRTIIVAQNKAPIADVGDDFNVTEGDSIDLNGSLSYDIDGSISKYTWIVDNNDSKTYLGEFNTSRPLSIGKHIITLIVADNYEKNSTEANLTVWVKIGYTNLRRTGQTISHSQANYDDGYYQYGGIDTNYTSGIDENNNTIVNDKTNGLIWERNITVVDTYTFDQAIDYLGDGRSLCELDSPLPPFSNRLGTWRLPTRKETLELLEYNKTTENISNIFEDRGLTYWTDTNDTKNAFYVNFDGAISNSQAQEATNNIRCVDDTNYTVPKDANFSRTANNTVIDYNTMLEWQDDVDVTDKNWTEALNYCHDLNLSENGIDWRVPNVRELLSIVDENQTSPTIDGNFTNTDTTTNGGRYWTSTTVVSDTTKAYLVSFDNGDMTANGQKSSPNNIRCVRTRREASFYQ